MFANDGKYSTLLWRWKWNYWNRYLRHQLLVLPQLSSSELCLVWLNWCVSALLGFTPFMFLSPWHVKEQMHVQQVFFSSGTNIIPLISNFKVHFCETCIWLELIYYSFLTCKSSEQHCVSYATWWENLEQLGEFLWALQVEGMAYRHITHWSDNLESWALALIRT